MIQHSVLSNISSALSCFYGENNAESTLEAKLLKLPANHSLDFDLSVPCSCLGLLRCVPSPAGPSSRESWGSALLLPSPCEQQGLGDLVAWKVWAAGTLQPSLPAK